MHVAMDSDTYVRLKCLEAVDAMADRAACADVYIYTDAEELADAVNVLAHAVTNGKDVAFDCSDNLRKTVSVEG